MKRIKSLKLLICTLLIVPIVLMPSCKSETELTQQELVTAQLVADGDSWAIESVTIDDVDEAILFSGFTIKFDEGVYATSNGGVVWPNTGTWLFTSDQATSFVRDDGIEVLIESISNDDLNLSFDWIETTLDTDGGRVTSRKGKHKWRFRRRK